MDEAIPYQHSYVVTATTARDMARAYVDHAFRLRPVWIFLAIIWLLFAAIFLVSMDTSYRLGTRVGWSLALGLVPTLVLTLALAILSYVRTRKSARTRVFDGAVLESGFGTDELVLRNPAASSRIRYSAIRSVVARGDYVFMRQHGVPLISVYPRTLFPDADIARIRDAGMHDNCP